MSTDEEDKYPAESGIEFPLLLWWKKAPTLLRDIAHSSKSPIYGKKTPNMHFHFTIVPFYCWGGAQRS